MIKKILVIRFRRVGDAVISSSICTSLKKSFPEAEIHYVLNKSIVPLFQHHPAIDKLIPFSDEEQKMSAYLKKIRQIVKETKYDLIVDTRSTFKTIPFSLFSLGTPYRIGRKKSYNKWVHNMRTDNKFRGDKDNAQMTLDLLNPLEKHFEIIKDPNFRLYTTPTENAEFKAYMEKEGVDFTKPVIVCAVTARRAYKIWKMDRMKEVLANVLEKYPNAQLIFNYGDKTEEAFARELYTKLGEHKNIFIDIQAKGMREVLAMFANSDFFFGNEGGPRHISQAMNIPSFAIFPPDIPKKNWLPNQSERFSGIELADFNPEAAKNKDLSFEQQFDYINAEVVWKGLDKMLEIYITNNK